MPEADCAWAAQVPDGPLFLLPFNKKEETPFPFPGAPLASKTLPSLSLSQASSHHSLPSLHFIPICLLSVTTKAC